MRPGGRGGAERIGGHVLTVGVAERRAGQVPLPRADVGIVVAEDRQPLRRQHRHRVGQAGIPSGATEAEVARGGRLSGTRGSRTAW